MQLLPLTLTLGLQIIMTQFRQVLFGGQHNLREGEDAGMGEGGLVRAQGEVVHEFGVVLLALLWLDCMERQHFVFY